MATSKNGTVIYLQRALGEAAMSSGTITDAAGNTWAISGGATPGFVAENGKNDSTTANVTTMAYADDGVWQENSDANWWYHVDSGYPWVQGTDPTQIGGPASPNNTVINSQYQTLVDGQGTSWSILNGQVTKDGKIDPTTADVTTVALENGHVWQENTAGYWYEATASGYPWGTGTKTSPVPGGAVYDFTRITTADVAGPQPQWPEAGSLIDLEMVNNHTLTGQYTSMPPGPAYAFTDTNGTLSKSPVPAAPQATLPALLNASSTITSAVSPNGKVLAGAFTVAPMGPDQNMGFIQNTASNTMLGVITTGGWMIAQAVNDQGVMVGTTDTTPYGPEELIEYNKGLSTITLPSGDSGWFTGINDANLAVGTFSDGIREHGFLFDVNTGKLSQLDVPGASDTAITGINAAGDIVGIYYNQTGAAQNSASFVAEPTTSGAGAFFSLGEHFGQSVVTPIPGHVTVGLG